MIRITKLAALFFFSGLLFTSCLKDNIENKETDSKNELKNLGTSSLNETIILGNQLENPYSVRNMEIAYANVNLNGRNFPNGFKIYPSHLYVRFLPENDEQLNILTSDTTIELFDYPLDYEIITPGISYHDPTISRDKITWQYCAVSANYKFPDVYYQVISNLFIPEEIPEYNMTQQDQDAIYDLVTEALRITGNLEDENRDVRWSDWYPSGTITVFDVIVGGQTPLIGAKARARRWFTTKICYTNNNGYFQTGSFKRAVNYSIKWERPHFNIRNGVIAQAYFDGPKMRSPWNLDISSGESLRIATIHRAATRYHSGNIGGLKRPGANTKIFISYLDNSGTGINWGLHWQNLIMGIPPNILIHGKDNNGNYRDTDDNYSTTIHELAHASHIMLMNAAEIQFIQVTVQLRESWANAIEWYITQIEYVELGFPDYDDPSVNGAIDRDHMQGWLPSISQEYTPMYIDFVDNYNQSLNESENLPEDRCPDGGSFDGVNCYIGTPPTGETAFIYADHFYHTPVGCCNCPQPGTSFDGANCYVLDIPDNSIGFIWSNKWYLFPAGDNTYPYDQVSNYTMGNLESYVVKYSYGLTSLRTKLKANKPANMTDKQIDVYLNFYFNL